MLTTVKGVYDNGKITLSEEPLITEKKADVIVTFLTGQQNISLTSKRVLGGLEGRLSAPDDFNEPLEDLKDYM